MTDERQFPVPRIFANRYQMIRELGRGGVATVFLCTDLVTNSLVAMKVLHSHLSDDVTTQRFLREIAYVSRLDHPSIPKIFDTGAINDVPFFTMSYVEGETLRDRLTRVGSPSIDEAVAIITQVIEPISYAHGEGILHRDIKPENIFLSSGAVHVLDFGVARAVVRSSGDQLTSTGLTVGTPAYLSPEQALGQTDLDERSDVYALGCVTFELIAGVHPFLGRTLQSVLAKRLAAAPPRLSAHAEGVPHFIELAVARALAKERDERWSSANEYASALRDKLPAHQVKTRGASPSSSRASRLIERLKNALPKRGH